MSPLWDLAFFMIQGNGAFWFQMLPFCCNQALSVFGSVFLFCLPALLGPVSSCFKGELIGFHCMLFSKGPGRKVVLNTLLSGPEFFSCTMIFQKVTKDAWQWNRWQKGAMNNLEINYPLLQNKSITIFRAKKYWVTKLRGCFINSNPVKRRNLWASYSWNGE